MPEAQGSTKAEAEANGVDGSEAVCGRHMKGILLVQIVSPKVFGVFGFSFPSCFSGFGWPNKVGKKEKLKCCNHSVCSFVTQSLSGR